MVKMYYLFFYAESCNSTPYKTNKRLYWEGTDFYPPLLMIIEKTHFNQNTTYFDSKTLFIAYDAYGVSAGLMHNVYERGV